MADEFDKGPTFAKVNQKGKQLFDLLDLGIDDQGKWRYVHVIIIV